MGNGGHLVLNNGTDCDWHLVGGSLASYQMEKWQFPSTIKAGTSEKIYIEWGQTHTNSYGWPTSTNRSDDNGSVKYSCDGHVFKLYGRNEHLAITSEGDFPRYFERGTKLDLGWRHDGEVSFTLCGTSEVDHYWASSLGTALNLLYDQRQIIRYKTLTEICIPGTHDSGMSEISSPTLGAKEANVATQSKSMIEQLKLGARYFDIRPVLGGREFYTGHYSTISKDDLSWYYREALTAIGINGNKIILGARGQSIKSIVRDINAFTNHKAVREEAVILELTEGMNSNSSGSVDVDLSENDWRQLVEELLKIDFLYRGAANPLKIDLDSLLFKNPTAAIIILLPKSIYKIVKGIFGSNLPNGFQQANLYDKYSDDNDVGSMVRDQVNKMENEFGNQDFCKLSWTLTQSTTNAVTSYLTGVDSIGVLASKANEKLAGGFFNQVSTTSNSYPNVISIDYLDNLDCAQMSFAVNVKRRKLNKSKANP